MLLAVLVLAGGTAAFVATRRRGGVELEPPGPPILEEPATEAPEAVDVAPPPVLEEEPRGRGRGAGQAPVPRPHHQGPRRLRRLPRPEPDRRSHLGGARGRPDPRRRRRRPVRRPARPPAPPGEGGGHRRGAPGSRDALAVELKSRLAADRTPAPRRGRHQRVALRRRQRRRQDHDHRQGRPAHGGRRPLGGAGRRRHVPGRGRRAAGHVGRAVGCPLRPGQRGQRPVRGHLRRRRGGRTPAAPTSSSPTRPAACTPSRTSWRSWPRCVGSPRRAPAS